jgi:hypothetical protein
MIAAPESRSFDLADGQVTFRFFAPDRFGHFLRDHVLNEDEPWPHLLHLKIKKQENLRQQFDSGDVTARDEVEAAAYPPCVEVLVKGIETSICRPVYVEFVQERRQHLEDAPQETCGFYFLADAGFLVVVRENLVRTARFEVGIKRGVSRLGLFREAWKHLRTRITRAEYFDRKGQEYVRQIRVVPVSSENWTICPE